MSGEQKRGDILPLPPADNCYDTTGIAKRRKAIKLNEIKICQFLQFDGRNFHCGNSLEKAHKRGGKCKGVVYISP